MSAFKSRMSRTSFSLCLSLLSVIISVNERFVLADQPAVKNNSNSAGATVQGDTIFPEKSVDNDVKLSRGWKVTAKGLTSSTPTEPSKIPIKKNVAMPLSSSARNRTATNAASRSRLDIKTVSAETPQPAESHKATQSHAAEPQASSEESGLSATERVKRMLAAQQAVAQPQPAASMETGAVSRLPESLNVLNPATEDPATELDPLEMEKAQRFLKLKMQLMQMKSRMKSPQELAAGNSELTPSASQQTDSEHGTPEPGIEFYSPRNQTHDSHDGSISGADSHAKQGTLPAEAGHVSDSHLPASAESDHAHGVPQHDSEEEHNLSELAGHGDQHESTSAAASALPGTDVVEGPIDRLGLANNLYAVGEYALALRMYEHVEQSELSAQQQIWAEYQAANCLRRLGKSGEASNCYRKIAGQPEAGWLSDQSRWWVDTLERIRQLEKSLESDNEQPVDPAPATPFAGARSDTDHADSDHQEQDGTSHPAPRSEEAKHGEH